MTILITRGEVIECVKQELELAGIVEKKYAAPDLRQLLPELKFTIVEALLNQKRINLHVTRGIF
ncbi:hypothetical protein [Vibrio chagasii]|uniref:Uncharacterized protein n=1 Tax=Vibrio chagasii TaxID=170679 RepID=A0A7Y4DUE0_9VIBR|nr:hypothetical protein [Vibrio chagasii]NOH36563.1 hypothetical protein [Vibrio chagasii]